MPALKALLSQVVATLATLALARSGLLPPLDLLVLACLQGVMAAFMSAWLRAAGWWVPLQLGFMPSVVLALHWQLPPWLYLTAFLLLCLVFWTTFRSQVPLYLSNRSTVHRLVLWLPDQTGLSVMDLGSGTGSFLAPLARLRPDWRLHGIEAAPLPAWLARRRLRKHSNARPLRGDFWHCSLAEHDVVYAFLSPVPMPRLWQKARREMKAGSWLVSNSFEVPGVKPVATLRTGDARDTHLYCYRMPGRGAPMLQKSAPLP